MRRCPAPADTIASIRRGCAAAATPDELFASVSDELGKQIPHDGSMWFGVDPATLLAVAPSRVQAMDPGYCNIFWHNEFHELDANRYHDLARSGVAAAGLRRATDDRPQRSKRFREFVRPQGYDDELRGLFRSGTTTWAINALYREKGRPAFDDADTALLAAISDIVGTAYRVRSTMAVEGCGPEGAPGLLVFDRHDRMIASNARAATWLEEIYGPRFGQEVEWLEALSDLPRHDLLAPFGIIPVIAQARAVAAGLEQRPARVRLRGRSGRWVLVHATTLQYPDATDAVAVVIEAASTADIAPIIIEAYGLTPREREVLREIARGTPTPQIATSLFLSVHTVRDHIKSIFEKVGVSSRGELVARLFAEHHVDDMHAALVHVDD